MGISLEAYRSRIGLHNNLYHGPKRTFKDSSTCGSRIKIGMLASLGLCLLLLAMSGVEQNPGPLQFQCKQCPAFLETYEAIFDHQKTHLSVPCFHEGCSYATVSFQSYKVHCSRTHGTLSVADNAAFKCPVPNCSVPKRSNSKVHLEEHLDLGQSFKCPYSATCKVVHRSKQTFRVHVSQVHKAIPLSLPTPTTSSAPSEASGSALPENLVHHPNKIKDEVGKFYLELEGEKVLPSSTVQFISAKWAWFTEMSHHCMEMVLKSELLSLGLPVARARNAIDRVLHKVFSADPVFNVHHKNKDPDPLTSIHYRKKELKKKFGYVDSIEIQLPCPEGPRRVAQYVPIRNMLESVLKDPTVKSKILQSFSRRSVEGIFEDYHDGSAFKKHLIDNNNHKCIQLVFFMDAFEYNPFGPGKGLYKTLGMYYYIGNLPYEYRSKVQNILLAFLIQEAYLKPNEDEYLQGTDKFAEAYDQLFKDLQELNANGILIDGEIYPVCVMFCTADNLGAHQVGCYSQSFSAEYCCRFCPISMTEFRAEPSMCHPFRTPEEYDQSVQQAKVMWDEMKERAIELHRSKKVRQAEKIAAGEVVKKKVSETQVSLNYLKKLQAVNHKGVKPFASALNVIPGYHVSNFGLPPCLAHDLFEGIVKNVLPKILQHFIVTKEWFTLATFNRRIKTFKFKGKDADDAPHELKSFDSINGNAVETWTLIRLLPLIIGDLIQDPEDSHWCLYLKLQEICEYVCAPKISAQQVAYLQTLINSYLLHVKQLLPECLTPKSHYLAHYPALILNFGPLIRLFTLRFESKHVFFKMVAKMCRNFKNIVFTLAQKYQFRFVLDHINGFLPPDVLYTNQPEDLCLEKLLDDVQNCVQSITDGSGAKTAYDVQVKGTYYRNGLWMVLDKAEIVDLLVGQIVRIVILPQDDVYFVLRTCIAEKSDGFYTIGKSTGVKIFKVADLPDYFPLPAYQVKEKLCISLKHSFVFMQV